MIIKILSSTGTFAAVRYNTDKMDRGDGELMKIANMPHLEGQHTVSPGEVKAYLKAHSATNTRIKNAQFHATISAKGREMDKSQLTEAAVEYMEKMGYGENPYIVVFHSDTENNHVHIVSSRVDNHGKKINDSHERRRSQAVRGQLMEKFGTGEDKGLDRLLSYRCQNESQLAKLLEQNGYAVAKRDSGLEVWHNGRQRAFLNRTDMQFADPDKKRVAQLRAIFDRYASRHSTAPVPVCQKLPGDRDGGRTTGYRSDFGDFMKAVFGIELVYHFSGDRPPFGYTVFDHNRRAVLKGSEVRKLALLLSPRSEPKRKERQEGRDRLLKMASAYNISTPEHLRALAGHYKIPEYRLPMNGRTLTDAERNYYAVLLDHHFRTGGWGDIGRLGITPVEQDGKLWLLDGMCRAIVDAGEFLGREILDSYWDRHPERGLSTTDGLPGRGIEWGWSMAEDVDDERTFGRERNRGGTGRKRK